MDMLRKGLLWVSAFVTAGFGVALIAVPAQLNELYGGVTNDSLVALSRVFGAVTLAFPVLSIMALRVEDRVARQAVDATFLTGWTLITVLTAWNLYVLPAGNAALVWSTIALYVLLAAGFAYELLGPDMRSTPTRARPIS